jgi:hypothetical protein
VNALPWVFALSAATGVLAFLADRVLKPWRARRLADAEERRAVAQLMSEQMQAGIKVLVGDPGDPGQGIPATDGLGKRMAQVEAQLKTNGGNSARDVLDKIHEVAIENAAANERMEEAQRQAAQLAGEAAILAGTADQRIREQGDIAAARHRDNQQRLERLEGAAREERLRRELYVYLLKDKYQIDLEVDDESGGT